MVYNLLTINNYILNMDQHMSSIQRLFIILCLTTMSFAATAAPIYYTFEGTVTSINDPYGQLPTSGEFSIGEVVNYTFLIDFDATGSWQYNGYNNFRTVETPDTTSQDYFYTALVSGSPVVSNWYDIYSVTNYGLQSQEGYSAYGAITGSNYLSLVNYNLNVSDWVIGTNVVAKDLWGTSSQSYYVQSQLTLTNIVDPTVVPLPGAIGLLSMGLISLLSFRRRKA